MDETLKRLQRVLDQAVEEKFIAGASVLVRQNGEERWYCQSGMRDIKQSLPVERDTIFRLYSMSKPVTAAAVMLLVERGCLDMGDPVSKFLPGFRGQRVAEGNLSVSVKREMNVKDLLCMTSGLSYPDESTPAGREAAAVFSQLDRRLYSDAPMTTEEVANALGACRLHFQPGERWMYGSSADVLGAVVEAVSGMRFGEFLKTELFAPLGMEDTGFYVPEEKQGRIARVYENQGGELTEAKTNHLGIRYTLDQEPAFQSGGAGLVSTLDDYARFGQMLLNGGKLGAVRILRPETVRFLTGGKLLARQQADFEAGWEQFSGYTYGNLMRVLERPGQTWGIGFAGEYGWDGWLGPYFCNDPKNQVTFLLMYQLVNAGTTPFTRKVRNVINTGLLSE